jgi:hypothetical protein
MKNSTVVILAGGLGNQIFQLASAIDHSQTHQIQLAYGLTDCDFNSIGEPVIADFELDSLGIELIRMESNLISRRIVNLILRLKSGKYGTVLMSESNPVNTILIAALKVTLICNSLSRQRLDSNQRLNQKLFNTRLQVGYYQRSPLGKETLEILRSSLKLKSSSKWLVELKDLSIKERPLVVHIRLGDYKKEKDFGILTVNYFRSAMQHLKGRQSFGKVWLFSDDPHQAIKYFSDEEPGNIRVISNGFQDASAELEAMRLGNGYVISNSSFSWWGASLSHTLAAPVCAPHPWFKGLSTFTRIYDENWYKIEI